MKREDYPYVAGLRAVAIAAVVAFHLAPDTAPGGYAGVDAFFVISGFIVSGSLHKYGFAGVGDFLRFFYARRFRRIVPALAVMLSTSFLLAAVFVPNMMFGSNMRAVATAACFGLSNFVLARGADYFGTDAALDAFTHTWSLGVEEQFYLIFPALFLLMRRWAGATPLLLALVLLSFASGFEQREGVFYSSLARFWELGAGVLAYRIAAAKGLFDPFADAGAERMPLTAAGVAFLAYGFFVSKPESFPTPGALAPVLGILCLIGALHARRPTSLVGRALVSGPALRLGALSYSLYLWHWPVIVLFRWTVGVDTPAMKFAALAIAVAAALASYHFVEQPCRYGPWLRSERRAIALSLAALAATWGAVTLMRMATPWLSASVVARHAQDWHPQFDTAISEGACSVAIEKVRDGEEIVERMTRVGCGPSESRTLHIVGDSHAWAYHAFAELYALRTGVRVVLRYASGCALLHTLPISADCRRRLPRWAAALAADASTSDAIFLPGLRILRYRLNGVDALAPQTPDLAEQMRASNAVEDARAALRILDRPGLHILVEAPKPAHRTTAFRCADWFDRNNPACAEGDRVAREEEEAHRRPAMEMLASLKAEFPRIEIFDPLPVLCEAQECALRRDGKPLFFDGDHISGFANLVLLQPIGEALARFGFPRPEAP
ncbi:MULTISPECIES: acyltransferase family protein [Methylosinus]|uniref:Acyltransferase n=1 Tax=Methylosinus trichosporium (strain ATCC 35070 / NCIMB 11131 / UNIQEM 75 / OB3b) TaxID=595536 RepID=A0A2D2CZZ4_METT3|nr:MULTISPECIES: acyltransferase family protein [Methylosinus]ATQ68305.1 acyltransferase [Methylosinus trichosporium OB3b]